MYFKIKYEYCNYYYQFMFKKAVIFRTFDRPQGQQNSVVLLM